MRHINSLKAAASVGSVAAIWHICWAALVALGWAQTVLDFILKLHFIQLNYTLAPFALGTATLLVVITFAGGAFFGLAFACIWNWLTGQPEKESRRQTVVARTA